MAAAAGGEASAACSAQPDLSLLHTHRCPSSGMVADIARSVCLMAAKIDR